MSKNGWFNYDDDDAFVIEKHVDGIVYGSKAVLLKLQKQFDDLYKTTKLEDAMYGFVIADALGVPAEFKSRRELSVNPIKDMVGFGSHKVVEGTWSDDTSMVLASLDSINSKNEIDYDDMMKKFTSWYKEGEYTTDGNVFDIGRTTVSAIRKYLTGEEAVMCGGTDVRDNGNGSLMRMLPIAFYIHDNNLKEERVQIVNQVSSLTHAHDISKLGCLIYCDYICELLKGNGKMQSLINIRGNDYSKYYSKDVVNNYKKILTGNLMRIPEEQISSSGYVVDTLMASIWCLLNTNNYKDAVLKAVNLGNDTDTVAAICGSYAGLIYSKKNIPNDWISKLKNKELLNNIISSYKIKPVEKSAYDIIVEQLNSRRSDVSFDKSLINNLTQEEKDNVDKLLINEILNHNVSCYYYIDCLNNVDKLDDKFLSTLTGSLKFVVLKGIYLVNRDKKFLNDIIEEAYQNIFCFDLLADIYLSTNDFEIYEIIDMIYSKMSDNEAYKFVAKSKLDISKERSI